LRDIWAPINRPELQKRLYMLLSITKLFMGHHPSHPHPDEPNLEKPLDPIGGDNE
jgi:hypothetical protein